MDGVIFTNTGAFAVCCVENLSDELKQSIKGKLTRVCHGANQSESGRLMHRYAPTIKAFWARYHPKSATTKVGMLGELLSHVILLDHLPKLDVVSPYFNLEEKSIRKGFDILLYESTEHAVWITEVKSGEVGKGKTPCSATSTLLAKARDDLISRLSENELNHWQNAIHAATIAISETSDHKKAVLDILYDEGDLVASEAATANDNNVFLIAALFTPVSTRVQLKTIEEFAEKLKKAGTFKSTFILSIQKGTLQKLHDFLKSEAGC